MALTSASLGNPALAQDPETAPEPDATPDPAVEEAARLFDDGETRYETADYIGAVEKFTAAYRLAADIEDEESRERAMTLLLYNLARAQVKAYGVDDDVARLKTARTLLEKYLERETDGAEDARELLETVEKELSAAEQEAADPSTQPGPSESPATSTPVDANDSGQHRDAPRRASPMFIAGITVTALAAPALVLMGVEMVLGNRAEDEFFDGPTQTQREDALRRGKTANTLAIVGGASAGVFAIVGATLIGISKKREASRSARLTPGPGEIGLGLEARF